MEIIQRILQMKEVSKEARSEGKIIGLVPTMGYLHEGHLRLVREARKMSDVVVVSIFVNPTQFSPTEDYATYPRNVPRDADLLTSESVDYLFVPKPEEMYPENYHTYVKVRELSEKLCGVSRPTHFEGVTTIISKLFHIVYPHFGFFGLKDAQQVVLIQRMVRDLNIDVEIVSLPIVRDSDGVAISSRNIHLSSEEREAARVLHRTLEHTRKRIEQGEKKAKTILKEIREEIESEPLARIDYVSATDMFELNDVKTIKGKCLIAVAVYFGTTRLIDNLIIQAE
jgi:pantoate--beta-alanine ligase